MSNYTLHLRHKETKEVHSIRAMDNYYAHYVYGYALPNGTVVNEDDLNELYEERDHSEEV